MSGWYANAESKRISLMQSVMELCWRKVLDQKYDITREQLAQAIVAIEVSGEKDATILADDALRLALASRKSSLTV